MKKAELKKLIVEIMADVLPTYVDNKINEVKLDIMKSLVLENNGTNVKKSVILDDDSSDYENIETVNSKNAEKNFIAKNGILEWAKNKNTNLGVVETPDFNHTETEIRSFVNGIIKKL